MSLKKKSETENTRSASGSATTGRFAYEGLDRLLHERARLGILTTLASRPEGVLFNDLKELCALTDGNLSRHLQVLHDSGVVEVWKRFESRRPQTLCRLSSEGRQRFLSYLAVLEDVVRDAAATRTALRRRARKGGGAGSGDEAFDASGWAPA